MSRNDHFVTVVYDLKEESPMQEALRLLKIYTGGSFDIWSLAGNAKASCRAHIMSLIKGQKIPQSKSGITALREEFHNAGNIQGECQAEREKNFVRWAKMAA